MSFSNVSHGATLLITLLLTSISMHLHASPLKNDGSVIVSDDTVLVKFVPGVKGDSKKAAHAQVQGKIKSTIQPLNIDVINVPKGSVISAIAIYSRNPNVVFAEPNVTRPIIYPSTSEGSEPTLGITNNFDEQYGLHNVGQSFGVAADSLGNLIFPIYKASIGADINAPEAWSIMDSENINTSVGVAVLDSGVECSHLDLEGKCIEAINYVSGQSSDGDVIGHGTHVAGIIAATIDNQVGIAGVAPNAQIGSMKVCWETEFLGTIIAAGCDDDDIASALTYVADSGDYKVINMSLAGTQGTQTLQEAVDYAWNAGLVIVAAAGNAYSTQLQYPAGYSNAIAVGATDYHDNLASYSTFGKSWVSVLAPGTAIMSTMPGAACGQGANEASDCYDWKSGTSMAAPHVAGLAAVLVAHPNQYSNSEIRAIIEDSSDKTGTLGQTYSAWAINGRIDMAASLGHQPDPEPPEVEATSHSIESVLAEVISENKGNKRGRATITILDNLGDPAVGVAVTGHFTGDIEEDVTMSTDDSGTAVLTTTTTSKGGVSFTVCVNMVEDSNTTGWDGVPVCTSL